MDTATIFNAVIEQLIIGREGVPLADALRIALSLGPCEAKLANDTYGQLTICITWNDESCVILDNDPT